MEKERAKRWEFLFERMYQADKSLNKPAFFDALDIEIHQALESQMSDLRKEVEDKRLRVEGLFANKMLARKYNQALDEVLLLMKK